MKRYVIVVLLLFLVVVNFGILSIAGRYRVPEMRQPIRINGFNKMLLGAPSTPSFRTPLYKPFMIGQRLMIN